MLVMKVPDLVRNESAQSVLSVRGIRKTYRRGFWGRRGEPAVADLSFEVAPGEVFALLGHNGAGKTTTLKAILDLVRPDAGEITICGRDSRRPEARARVGYLPEAPYFHENLTAAELLDFYGKLLGLDRSRRRRRSGECLELVSMTGESKRRLADCSKGMRQRIGLAQALLAEPELLILDEPQSGLDPLGRRQFREILLEQKRRGITVIFSSHIVPDVEAVADRVAMIRHGRLDEIRDLRRQPQARSFLACIAPPPPNSEIAGVLDEPELSVTSRDRNRWTVEATGSGALGRLLAACDSGSVAVLDVQVHRGDLESDFLAGLVADRPAQEVVPC
jgi:ABC-2 type transport system ATP-binding protein